MELVDARTFEANRAWGARELLDMGAHAARLHWTDKPYRWHENTGDELFVVLDGVVEMQHVQDGVARSTTLVAGHMAVIRAGERHVAHPRGPARVLVVERRDSA